MAEWKKVIVSGSTAQLATLQVGSNQQIGTTQATTYLTGSFTGSFSGNGSGLTNVTATATFPTTLLTPLNSATQIFANDGVNKYVTAGQITGSAYAGVSGDITINTAGVATIAANSVALSTDTTGDYVATIDAGAGLTGGATSGEGVAHTLAVGAGNYITVNANDVAVNTTTLTPAISGSIFSQVSGDITITTAGVATIGANSVALGTDTTGDYVATIDAGAGLTGGATSGESVAHTLAVGAGNYITVNANDVAVNTTTLTPAISGSIFSQVSGDITITTAGVATIGANAVAIGTDVSGLGAGVAAFLATPNSANLATALTDETGTAGSVVFSAGPTLTGTTNVAALAASGNVTIAGNLNVSGLISGSATYITSTNVAITDQFILLASGSGATVDAGIIVQDAAGDGEAFYWENNTSGTGRWAIASNVNPTTTTVAAAEYVVSARTAVGAPSGNPTYGGGTNGYGQIYVNSSGGDIYIYA